MHRKGVMGDARVEPDGERPVTSRMETWTLSCE